MAGIHPIPHGLFLVREKTGYRYLPPDPYWRSFLLPGQSGSAATSTQQMDGIAGWLHRRMYEKSYAYTALFQLWRLKTMRPSDWYANVVAAVSALKALPGGDERFGDWSPPDDLTLDQMFYAKEMPPVFVEALEDTKAALRAWQRKARLANARLLILATHSLEHTAEQIDPRFGARRQADAGRQLKRLKALAGELNIPDH